MKKLELDRKTIIVFGVVCMIITLILSCVFLILHINHNKISYIPYEEKSTIDYKVKINKNDYFDEDYLLKDKQYIARLIKDIEAEFRYKFNIEEDFEYNYKYKIMAHVNVIENDTRKEIYTLSDELLKEKEGNKYGEIAIDEKVKVNYKKYNDLINTFINVYKLSDITSKLTIKMYIEIEGVDGKFDKQESNLVVDVPLTENTVSIDSKSDLASNSDNLISLIKEQKNSKFFCILSIILFVIDIIEIVIFIIYLKKTETEEEKYNAQLKKILNNYGSYISKIEDKFDMSQYQILKVQNFVDLLEIRDTMQIPIILVENKETLAACFMIPTMNNILYFYTLGEMQLALPSNSNSIETDIGEKDVQEV